MKMSGGIVLYPRNARDHVWTRLFLEVRGETAVALLQIVPLQHVADLRHFLSENGAAANGGRHHVRRRYGFHLVVASRFRVAMVRSHPLRIVVHLEPQQIEQIVEFVVAPGPPHFEVEDVERQPMVRMQDPRVGTVGPWTEQRTLFKAWGSKLVP